jgi:hypothetical protein
MSEFRVSLINITDHKSVRTEKFDNKEDAEHHAKNQSEADDKHIYEIQKNHQGDFVKIKAYLNGEKLAD